MSWWNPLTWLRKKPSRPLIPVPSHGHKEIAAEFFFLPYTEQLQVLFYLGVEFKEQRIILDLAKPFKDVKSVMSSMGEPKNLMGADMFLDRVKAIYFDGRLYAIEAAFQNIFRDKAESEYYASKVESWGDSSRHR